MRPIILALVVVTLTACDDIETDCIGIDAYDAGLLAGREAGYPWGALDASQGHDPDPDAVVVLTESLHGTTVTWEAWNTGYSAGFTTSYTAGYSDHGG